MARIDIVDRQQFRECLMLLLDAVESKHKISSKAARSQILESMGLSAAGDSTYFTMWTQNSRLVKLYSIDEQYLASLAVMGINLQLGKAWVSEFLSTTEFGRSTLITNRVNRALYDVFFRKARLNDAALSENELDALLGQFFSENYFEVNRVYTADNHLYMELIGTSLTPLRFCVRNETTKFQWEAVGSQLNDEKKLYKPIHLIGSAHTWYTIDISCDDGKYGVYVDCLTSAEKPFFCRDVRINPVKEQFMPRVFPS